MKYGVTKNGFVKKRLDVILSELRNDISDGVGFDVAQNPQSFMNVFITEFADRISQMWEVAEQNYYSMYPATAEGVNLDNAVEFGGISRVGDRKSKYFILCAGLDGTIIPKNTRIVSATNPKIYFSAVSEEKITRENCNCLTIKPIEIEPNAIYSITINSMSYNYTSFEITRIEDILNGLCDLINADNTAKFTAEVLTGGLVLKSKLSQINYGVCLSDNLTTEKAATVIPFESEEYGKFVLPQHSINEIITGVSGFLECANVGVPIYGNLRESDIELRHDYIKKIASRSETMLASVESGILENVDGVLSCRGFENPTNITDSYGRPPHSIEMVVDGGNEEEIAHMILVKKAAGIQTFGDILVDSLAEFGDVIPIRFNRPKPVFVWIKVAVHRKKGELLPVNFAELITKSIIDQTKDFNTGETLFSQSLFAGIYSVCSGISYIDMLEFATINEAEIPTSYDLQNVACNNRSKLYFSAERIEVVLNAAE